VLTQRRAVATTTDRTVQDNIVRGNREPGDDLVYKDGYM
jgi:hypothetical protein